MALTDTRVKSARPRLADYTLADGNGLHLRVRRNGTKTWITRRMIAGTVHVQTIGVYSNEGLSLVEARAIAAGKAIGSAPPDKRTVQALGEQYVARVIERRYKTAAPVARYFARDIYPAIGSKRVTDVVPSDIDRLLQTKLEEAGPVATNMLLLLLRGMFTFAIRTGWGSVNPAAAFTRAEAGGKQSPRQRVLTDDELRALWATPTEHVGAIRLAMLTGARIGEACDAKWSQIDLKRKRWTLPASATKQKREHWIHLAPPAIALLSAQPCAGERVFPGANRIVLANTLIETRRRGANEDPDYRIHDARRSMASRLGETGVNPLVIELLLGHALPRLLATYNVAQYERERIGASEQWATQLTKIINTKRRGAR